MSTTWYLWPVNNDPVTNEYLAKAIGEQNPECEYRDKLCADGKKRNLFRCPAGYENVQTAMAAIPKFNLKLEVFKEDDIGTGAKSAERIIRYDLWKMPVQKTVQATSFLRSRRRRFIP